MLRPCRHKPSPRSIPSWVSVLPRPTDSSASHSPRNFSTSTPATASLPTQTSTRQSRPTSIRRAANSISTRSKAAKPSPTKCSRGASWPSCLTTSPRPSISSRFYTHHVWLFSDGGMLSISTRSCTGPILFMRPFTSVFSLGNIQTCPSMYSGRSLRSSSNRCAIGS